VIKVVTVFVLFHKGDQACAGIIFGGCVGWCAPPGDGGGHDTNRHHESQKQTKAWIQGVGPFCG
jgi:hypothetical protein